MRIKNREQGGKIVEKTKSGKIIVFRDATAWRKWLAYKHINSKKGGK